MTSTNASPDPDPGIHHDAIQVAKALVEFREYDEHLIVLVHDQRQGFRAYAMCLTEFLAQRAR